MKPIKLFAFLPIFLFLLSAYAYDPQPSAKIDTLLVDAVSSVLDGKSKQVQIMNIADIPYVDVWITLADPSFPRSVLKESGAVIRTDLGTILTAWIPANQVEKLAEIPQVISLESGKPLHPCLDRSIPETRTDAVWQNLGNGNRGKGVIVGIIDSGIDYKNGDFRTADDHSRILALWDQLNNTGPAPTGFNYGKLWDKTSLDQKTCVHVPRGYHGTHVAGIAAGDGSETGNGQPAFQYVGVAPESDLLVVHHEDDVRDTQILDAVNWIFQTAGDRPVSVNMSFGAHYGLHDGSYTLDQALDQLVGPGKPGRVISAAVGNEGSSLIHAKTILKNPQQGYYPYLRIWSPDDFDNAVIQVWYSSAKSVRARLWVPKDENAKQYVMTDWVEKNGRHVMQVDSGIFQGIIVTVDARQAPYPNNSAYNLITVVLDKNDQSYNFQKFNFDLELDGEGVEIESWIAMAPNGVAFEQNPNDALLIQPDSETTIGTPASALNVIGVASYTTKNTWVTVDGGQHEDTAALIGKIAESSSRGPLRNGGKKPDLAAPGQYIVSSWYYNLSPDYGNKRGHSVPDGKHYIDGGTSMASPHVCGTAALLLQKNPKLDAGQIKQILLQTAIDTERDGWDGRWGAGKLDVKTAWDAVPTIAPTATPVTISSPLPTNTPIAVPPTWTPTRTATPTPLPIFPSPTPMVNPPGGISPIVVYEFNQLNLAACGWSEIPGGFIQSQPGQISFIDSLKIPIPSSQDGKGMVMRVQAKQVVFVYAQTPIYCQGLPIVIRATLRADRPEAAIALAALKGNLSANNGVDGSIGTHVPATASGFIAGERSLVLIYEPDSGEIITPILQVASTSETAAVTIGLDKIEVYSIQRGGMYPGYLFYGQWNGAVSQYTPTPLIPPTNTPIPLPTWTPTNVSIPTPTFTPTFTPILIPTFTATPMILPNHTPTFSPTPIVVPTATKVSSGEWVELAKDLPNDMEGGQFDINQVYIQVSSTTVAFRITVYTPWANTETRKHTGIFKIFLDTDNNPNTGDPDHAGADYLLFVGADFFTEEYAEIIEQWSDPDGLDLWDFYESGNLKSVANPNLTTLDITVDRAQIGNPAMIRFMIQTTYLETYEQDQCPDTGVIKYP